MSLILVVEPDAQHAAQFASMARHHLHAELVMAESGDRAVAALAHRVPDIVLTAPLLPHHDEAVLCDYLRAFGEAAAHVQTLTIPILSAPSASQRGIRGRFKRDRTEHNLPDGCDPAIFAEQVVQYLHNARQRRSVVEAPAPVPVAPPAPTPAPMPAPVVMERAVPATIIEEADRDFYAAVEDDDLDLTPLLTKLSDRERTEAALAARERAEAMAQPAAPMQRLEPVEPVQPVQRPLPVEAVQRFEPVEPAIERRAHVEPVIERREHVEPVLQRLEPIEPVRRPEPVAPVRRVEPMEPVRRIEPMEPVHQQLVPVEPVRKQPEPVERVRRREVIEPREPQVIVEPVEKPKPRARVAPAAPAPPAGMLVPVDRSGWLSRLRPDDRDDDPIEPVESTALAPVEPRQVQVPQIITVPTGNGGTASVNVAVAVSVQVNAQVATVTPPPGVRRRPTKPMPVQDEWGFFDPNQCGFEALLARLDAIAAKDDDE